MSSTFFVDTGILVSVRDATEPDKQGQAERWMVDLWRSRSGRLSYQVLEEFYVTVTRKLDPGLSPEVAREDVRAFEAWRPLAVDGAVLERAWALQGRHGLAFWDATIVAAAQLAGCRFLLTDGLRHGLQLEGLEVLDPFEHVAQGPMIHEGS